MTLPTGYVLESLFDPIVIENEFGMYKASVTNVDGSKLIYQRELIILSGRHPKEKFAEYVAFRKNIVKKDKSKMVLIKENIEFYDYELYFVVILVFLNIRI